MKSNMESNLGSNNKRFKKNLMAAFIAQGVSLMMSVLMSLVVPKFLGVIEYSYWQLFIFYVGYVGFFHFGFNDGLYLRLGGKEYKSLDFKRLGTELRLFTFAEIVTAVLISVFAITFVSNPDRKFILIIASIYLVLNNLTLYFGYIFQAVNETNLFSYSVIVDRIFVLITIAALLLFKVTDYVPFILAYTVSKFAALIYCFIKGKQILLSGGYNLLKALKDMWRSISIGIKLTIANIVSMLILGTGRLMIDNIWGIETFGKISLSLTMTNFFLLFIQQVSMVLFPALRRVDGGRQEELYVRLREILGIVLPIVLVGYIPLRVILSLWLPQYVESLKYLALLLPICTFDGKMQMLYNTYFKVIMEETALLLVNIASFMVSAFLVLLGGVVFNNLFVVILSMLFAIAFRSILAEVILSHKMRIKVDRAILLEIGFVVIFIITAWFCTMLAAFLIDLGVYAIYLFCNASKVKNCMAMIKKKGK